MERRELVKSMLLAAAGASVAGISSSAESSGEATSNSVGFDKLRPGSFKNDGAKTIKLSPEMFLMGGVWIAPINR